MYAVDCYQVWHLKYGHSRFAAVSEADGEDRMGLTMIL